MQVKRVIVLASLWALAGAAAEAAGAGGVDRRRAEELARAGGFELIDGRACAGGPRGCLLLAVRQPDGEAFVYRVHDVPCTKSSRLCLGEIAADPPLATRQGPRARPGSAAKVSAKPGEDGAPPDPQHEAQADAMNEILEALADGKYDGALPQFWADLESVQTWNHPTWRQPDPPPPTTDAVRATGAAGSAAVLISGRFRHGGGARECRAWVGYSSPTAAIPDVGNWIGNAAFDGCDSEVAVFSSGGAAELIGTERRWSAGGDDLDYALGPPVKVPTTVWVVYADTSFADERAELERQFARANQILRDSRCGVELTPMYYDKTTALADPAQTLGCGGIDSLLAPQVGLHADRMNVYVVKSLAIAARVGVACKAESDNVILVDQGRDDETLVHEFGHWFDLDHNDDMPLVNPRNIMSNPTGDMLTAGQCYRVNFSKWSYINKQNLRRGKTRNCRHLQDADDECPGLKNEF